jgi:hypothetical protein
VTAVNREKVAIMTELLVDLVRVRDRALDLAIKCPSDPPLTNAQIIQRAEAFFAYLTGEGSTVAEVDCPQRHRSDASAG